MKKLTVDDMKKIRDDVIADLPPGDQFWSSFITKLTATLAEPEQPELRPMTIDEWTERRHWILRHPTWDENADAPLTAIDYVSREVRIGVIWYQSSRLLDQRWQMRRDSDSEWQPCGLPINTPTTRDVTGDEMRDQYFEIRLSPGISTDQQAWDKLAAKYQRKAGV